MNNVRMAFSAGDVKGSPTVFVLQAERSTVANKHFDHLLALLRTGKHERRPIRALQLNDSYANEKVNGARKEVEI